MTEPYKLFRVAVSYRERIGSDESNPHRGTDVCYVFATNDEEALRKAIFLGKMHMMNAAGYNTQESVQEVDIANLPKNESGGLSAILRRDEKDTKFFLDEKLE